MSVLIAAPPVPARVRGGAQWEGRFLVVVQGECYT
jgi:hypothetical protein